MKSVNRRCTLCRNKIPAQAAIVTQLKAFCCYDHAIQWTKTEAGKKAIEKVKRHQNKVAKEKLKTLTDYAKEAELAFNAWIRFRDRDKPCISCGRDHQGQYHAGHYRTVKAAKQIRYHAWNVHKQCSTCNNYDSGNIVEYRINLIKRIGQEKVEWLESNHELAKYDIEYLKRLKKVFTKRLKIEKKIVDSVTSID